MMGCSGITYAECMSEGGRAWGIWLAFAQAKYLWVRIQSYLGYEVYRGSE